MTAHNPVTTILTADTPTAAHIHFHCGCGTTHHHTILDTHVHPAHRYTAALRRLHTTGRWPTPTPGDDAADGGTQAAGNPGANL